MPPTLRQPDVAEGLEEIVQKDLRLALFVASDLFGAPCGEFGEFVPAGHDGVLQKDGGTGEAFARRVLIGPAEERRTFHGVHALRLSVPAVAPTVVA
jgi:hypothetical protein